MAILRTYFTVSGMEDIVSFLNEQEAITVAKQLGSESEDMIYVYGNCKYTKDHHTKGHAKEHETYFWRKCGFSAFRNSWDGR